MITLYYQTKTPIGFWYKWRLNPRSLIQPSETLLVELTETHERSFQLRGKKKGKKKGQLWEWRLYFSTILHGQVSFYIASQPHPVQLLKDGMSLSPFSFLITMMETTLFLHMMHKLSLSKKHTHTHNRVVHYLLRLWESALYRPWSL